MFDVSKWTSSEHSDETAVVDMELLLQKAQDILLEEDIALPGTERLRGVARRLRYQIATREPLSSGETVDLQIATMWGAKGITAEHVYLLGACDEAIPGARREDYPGSDEDYVEGAEAIVLRVDYKIEENSGYISSFERESRRG